MSSKLVFGLLLDNRNATAWQMYSSSIQDSPTHSAPCFMHQDSTCCTAMSNDTRESPTVGTANVASSSNLLLNVWPDGWQTPKLKSTQAWQVSDAKQQMPTIEAGLQDYT